MSTRSIKIIFLGVERGRLVELATLPPSAADCLENVGSLTSHSPRPPLPATRIALLYFILFIYINDHLCGLVVTVPGYGFTGPGSIPGATRFPEK
jgi:hypothetical protein